MRTRFRLSSTALIVLAATLAACRGDQPLSPKLRTNAFPAGAPRPDVIVTAMSDDSTSADIDVTSTGGKFTLGKHGIYFPAGSICDPSTSTYGVTEWDQPCDPATEPVHVHAELRTVDGQETIDFTPALRFVPSSDPMQYVWLYMRTDSANVADASQFNLAWAPFAGGSAVDESHLDATMRTYLWQEGGIVFRRIKHFSAYQVIIGLAPSVDDTGEVVPLPSEIVTLF
jgi:hypothetical protein